jgi:hypothetical protein
MPPVFISAVVLFPGSICYRVVKLHTTGLTIALPLTSLTPVVIRATNVVLAASAPPVGEKVAVKLSADRVTVPGTITVVTAFVTVKFVAGETIVVRSIAWLKVAEIITEVDWFIAPSGGVKAVTVGADPVPVVKLQTLSAANALPLRSLAPVVIVAVYSVSGVRSASGVKVAVWPEATTVPDMEVPAVATVKVVVVTVAVSIAWLKFAMIVVSTATPVAPAAGTVELTVGPVVPPPNDELVPLHPVIRTTRSIIISHVPEYPLQVSARIRALRRFKPDKPLVANLILSFIFPSCIYTAVVLL